jgi:hypothetical protein
MHQVFSIRLTVESFYRPCLSIHFDDPLLQIHEYTIHAALKSILPQKPRQELLLYWLLRDRAASYRKQIAKNFSSRKRSPPRLQSIVPAIFESQMISGRFPILVSEYADVLLESQSALKNFPTRTFQWANREFR